MGKQQNFHTRILFLLQLTFFHRTAPKITGLRLNLIPWDSPNSPLYPGNLTPIQKYQRISAFSHRFQSISLHRNPNSIVNLDKIQFPVQHQNNFRYSVDVKIGTPGNVVKLLVDTGSGFIWTICSPTSYLRFSSKTYKKLPCNHRLCAKKICKCIKNQCICTIPYGSSGYKYKLAGSIDKFSIPGSEKSKADIVFGCSNQQPLNLSGILGLDRTPVSLVSQMRRESGGRFSYCLHNGDSYLTLGTEISGGEGKEVKTTPLIHTDYSALFLNLTDISVDGKRVGLSPSLFSLKNGGVFMDTGVQYTVLTKKAYYKVDRAFQSYFKGKLKKINSIRWNLKPCYRLTPGFNDYPKMTFHFDGADLEAKHTHVTDEIEGVTCTAVVPGKTTIIGAVQQWNTRFIFDINKNVLKFYRDDCAGRN